MTKQVYIETYGCQMNVSDTDTILGLLKTDGYSQTQSPDDADVILVNTCAIRDNAEQRVYGRVGELKRHKQKGGVLGVVGCMAQRLGSDLLEEVGHVDLVVGPDGYRTLPELIERAGQGDRVLDVSFRTSEHYDDVVGNGEGTKGSRFVTVQRGCNYRCTFCVVPMTRGDERSRKLSDVIGEVERLAEADTTEVTLLGQTVNSYNDGTHDFSDLLRAVGKVDGIKRVRFTSPHPNDFSDRLLSAMAEVPEVCEHVHLPMQSGSSAVLKKMVRRYTRESFLDTVQRLRSAVPEIALTTDIIVGFPGETDRDFEETLSLVREVSFDDAFMFKYSLRDGTPAVKLRDRVPEDVSSERLQLLIETVRDEARRKNLRLVGKTMEVLVEKPARRGDLLQARTRTNKVVLVENEGIDLWSYLHVRLTGTTGSTFTGVPVKARKELAVWE